MTVPGGQARRNGSGRFAARIGSGVENPLVVGERGAGLARMRRLGLPVPDGFTLTTDAWRAWQRVGAQMPLDLSRGLRTELVHLVHHLDHLDHLAAERRTGGRLGLAVRPSPPVRVPQEPPAKLVEVELDLAEDQGRALPRQLMAQVREAVESIWRAWDPEPAYASLRTATMPRERGIAVVVQRAVASEGGERFGHGRLLTRDPETGAPGAVGCFAPADDGSLEALRLSAPTAYAALSDGGVLIESAYTDMCEIAFAIDDGELWMLDARPAERSPTAAVRVAVDLVEEGLIELDEALERISLPALEELQRAAGGRDASATAAQLGRLLTWCDERREVSVSERPPSGWPSVS
ncbi:MAG: pyruvate phosphate dikinase, partial [Solirubrobacterales bacterium]|nr:pyruvate phosphate dikinase [Solirubrobacterales bacterium]